MSRRHDRARANLRGSARHSDLMSGGRGDPRDHRREGSRLTDNAFDPEVFEIDAQGRLTLKASVLAGLRITLSGAPLADRAEGRPTDALAPIPDPADAPATADDLREDVVANVLPPIRDALSSLAAKVNGILSDGSKEA